MNETPNVVTPHLPLLLVTRYLSLVTIFMYLDQFQSYDHARREFVWQIPDTFNIATEVCRRHSDSVTRIALVEVRTGGNNVYTFGGLDYLSDKFAVVLTDCGLSRGDVVALNLGPSAAFAVALLGTLKIGGLAAPIPPSVTSLPTIRRAKTLVVDRTARDNPGQAMQEFSGIETVFVADDNIHGHTVAEGERSFWREIYAATSDFRSLQTESQDPALVFTVTNDDEALHEVIHNHASLLGNLPAFEMRNAFDLGGEQVFWTPADWTHFNSLMGMILPAWYYGHSVVAHRATDLERIGALRLIDNCEVTAALMSASQLRLMRANNPNPATFDLRLKRILTLNEIIPEEVTEWAEQSLVAGISRAYGRTRVGILSADCDVWFPSRGHLFGRPVPGYELTIVDDSGRPLPPGSTGRVAVRSEPLRPFVRSSEQDRESTEGWRLTTDRGVMDDGYLGLVNSLINLAS